MVEVQKIRIEMIKDDYNKSQSKIKSYKKNRKDLEETIANLENKITDLKINYNSINAKYESALKENAFYEKELELRRNERTKNINTKPEINKE